MISAANPKISVLMCNYNYGDYVGQAIQSVLDQTYDNFELIIVDDGSSDHSADEINKFTDPRIHALFQQNQGQAGAFNSGIELCRGEFVAFLDSDDWWANEKLEVVIRAIETSRVNLALIQHQMMIWSEGEQRPYKRILPTGDCFGEMKATGKLDYFVPTSGITIPTGICRKVFPVPLGLRLCADAFLTRTATAFGTLLSIPESLGFYRKHDNTVFENSEFDDIGLYNTTLIPELLNFYQRNGFSGVEIRNIGGQKEPEPRPHRSFPQRALGRLARILQNLADH